MKDPCADNAAELMVTILGFRPGFAIATRDYRPPPVRDSPLPGLDEAKAAFRAACDAARVATHGYPQFGL
jgi:hypothetical protein